MPTRAARSPVTSSERGAPDATGARLSRFLTIDIGGSGLKAAVVDRRGQMIGDRVRVRTPHPCPPDVLLGRLLQLVAPLGPFDCVAVGFPGVVGMGRSSPLRAWNRGPQGFRPRHRAGRTAPPAGAGGERRRNPGSRCDRGGRPRDDHHAWNGFRDGAVRRRPVSPTSRAGASSVSQGQDLRATAWKEGTTEGRPQEVEPNTRAGHPHAPDARPL